MAEDSGSAATVGFVRFAGCVAAAIPTASADPAGLWEHGLGPHAPGAYPLAASERAFGPADVGSEHAFGPADLGPRPAR
ncbi:MAG: hypothetical protein ACHEUT_11290 [Corynebacterium pyruviciproducens]|uniref:hypothetical protein n=1 Tax=Corynebacterium pyruviciproducens TaxID=598660 RepID=UPI003983C527